MAMPTTKILAPIGKALPVTDGDWLAFFSKWYIWSTLLAIIFGGIALLASNGIRIYSERIGKLQNKQISDTNERASKADERAGKANVEAGNANERAGKLEVQAEAFKADAEKA